ncbi:zinc ABC transporter substrate-binding protein AztC [soil metagenome]
MRPPALFSIRRGAAVALVLAVGGSALVGCGSDGSDTDSGAAGDSPVVASTSIWADVTSNVLCDTVTVPALIPIGTDAHSFEPTIQDADTLRAADLVVVNGLNLEEGLQDALKTASSDGARVLELGPDLSPLEVSEEGHEDGDHEEDGHDHDGADPHVWMDPDRVATAVPLIADALRRVDGLPVDDDQIDQCASDYVAELTALSAEMDAALQVVPADSRKLVTNHESLGYFADRFDFQVVGAVIPSTSSLGESNPRELDELAATMQDQGVRAVFAETTSATALSKALAQQVGGDVQVVELFTESLGGTGTPARTYVEMMRTDAGLIASALGDASLGSTGTPAK